MTPERAHAEFDEITLQVFWKKWPGLSAWAGSLWRMLSEELGRACPCPLRDAELDEVGGSEMGPGPPGSQAMMALRDLMNTRVSSRQRQARR